LIRTLHPAGHLKDSHHTIMVAIVKFQDFHPFFNGMALCRKNGVDAIP
jgi:hypothetical protein